MRWANEIKKKTSFPAKEKCIVLFKKHRIVLFQLYDIPGTGHIISI